MYFFYIDEAGCLGELKSYNKNLQPIFLLSGLAIPAANLFEFTQDFLNLKANFHPKESRKYSHYLDFIKFELKGAGDIRKAIRSKTRNARRHSMGFLDKLLRIIEKHNCKIMSYVYIKEPDVEIDSKALYTKAMQYLLRQFDLFLTVTSSQGIVIADSRSPELNIMVSHSIFTQKFKVSGDGYHNILELPLYGHSHNHAAIQVTDIICSSLLFPIAGCKYCLAHIENTHLNPKYFILSDKFAQRMKLLFSNGQSSSHLKVVDKLACHGSELFWS